MMDKKYKVYKRTNKINGKIYIGITSRTLKERANRNGSGYVHNVHFWNAIQKYGWNNFDSEILFDNLTEEEAKVKEIELIKQYNSTDQNIGYNISEGGTLPSSSIKKEVNLYSIDGTYLKSFESTVECANEIGVAEANVSSCAIGKIKVLLKKYVVKFSSESKKENQEPFKFEYKNTRSVIQKSLDGKILNRFKTIQSAIDITGIPEHVIKNSLYLQKHSDFVWEFGDNKKVPINHSKRVAKYSLDGKFIQDYDTIAEAARDNNIGRTAINNCCVKNSSKYLSGNYLWRYYDGEKNSIEKYSGNKIKYRVGAYLNGKLFKDFDSISDAAIFFNYRTPSLISRACHEPTRTVLGYKWKYIEPVYK